MIIPRDTKRRYTVTQQQYRTSVILCVNEPDNAIWDNVWKTTGCTPTPRQKQIIRYLAETGQSDKEIGKHFSLAVETIRGHMRQIRVSFKCNSRQEIMAKIINVIVQELYNIRHGLKSCRCR